MKYQTFKSGINCRILIYWCIFLSLVILILTHIDENPYGLIILIIVLSLPVIFTPVSVVQLSGDILLIKKYYLFYRRTFSINLKIKRIRIQERASSLTGGDWLIHGSFNWSLLTHIVTGELFYQSTGEINVYDKKASQLLKQIKLNISSSDLKRLQEKL